jgi:SRSO17 transposase
MLDLSNKSFELIAAALAPARASAEHQSLHHFVANSEWSSSSLLDAVRDHVVPHLGIDEGCYWIVDDSGTEKHGKESACASHQYCGNKGKQAVCQVAVSLSLASEEGSIPVAYDLYTPAEWANDPIRRDKCGIPPSVQFATKPAIALRQITEALAKGIKPGVVLADAGYGEGTEFRDGLTDLGLPYVVGIKATTTFNKGKNEPVSAIELAESLMAKGKFKDVTWREGTGAPLKSQFAMAQVLVQHPRADGQPRTPEILLIEWQKGAKKPRAYCLCTPPGTATLEELVFIAKMRWRIERDYRELKQEFGMSDYQGRNWLGFHHHGALCVATYGFLLAQRLSLEDSTLKKSPVVANKI